MTANQLQQAGADRPLAACIGATQGAVRTVQDAHEPMAGYKAIARLSGHLAAMCRTVYPLAGGQPGADGQLRAACLRRARDVEWILRLLQCHLSGEASVVGRSAAADLTLLAQCLGDYWSAERTLVTWLEAQLAAEAREELARKYRHALTRAPTRPHPRSLRSGRLGGVAFWLHGRWDRFLDTVDSRPGVGRDFLVPAPLPRDPGVPAQGRGIPQG